MRVWDMPTGRCLSWLSFDSPVLSMAMSHSGEYLSLTQAGKEGIYMYVDRSLFETVHFWKEPTSPVSVADSLAQIEQPSREVNSEDGLFSAAPFDNEPGESQEMDVRPAQPQVETGAPKESEVQRGTGLITMAAVARAYWTSLFNLEAIKTRNSATAAPAPATKAPFFLPTVVRGGSTPSFPTPAEFDQIMRKSAAVASTKAAGLSSDLKRKGEAGKEMSELKKSKDGKELEEEDEASILAQLASMGSAWGDGEEAGDSWGSGPAAAEEASSASTSSARSSAHAVSAQLDRQSTSRIINRKTALPRCKLVAFILQEYPAGAPDLLDHEGATDIDTSEHPDDGSAEGPIMVYLKSLPPPAVDLEFRALCTHENDDEGTNASTSLLAYDLCAFKDSS
jgi:Utp21 specific WD40 associated putative domain